MNGECCSIRLPPALISIEMGEDTELCTARLIRRINMRLGGENMSNECKLLLKETTTALLVKNAEHFYEKLMDMAD